MSQLIVISDAGRELVALGNSGAMLGFLEAASAAELATVYTSLDSAIDAVAASVAGKANASHQHAIADVTGLQAALDAVAPQEERDQPYSGTIVFTGTTAPSGTATLRFSWVKIGRIVNVNFRFEWTVAGSAITRVVFPAPANLPAPEVLTGQGNGEVVCMLSGGLAISQLADNMNINASEARLQRNSSGGLEIWVRAASTSLAGLSFAGSYNANN